MIFETDTHRVLVWDNAAWVMIADTDEPPAMQLTNSTDFVNTTTIQINNCFNSNFRNYLVMCSFRAHVQGTGSVDIRLRSGGSNTSASSYVWQGVNQAIAGTAPSSNAGSGASIYASNIFSATDGLSNFETKFFNPHRSDSATGIHNSTFFAWDGATYYYRTSYGAWITAQSFDGFSIIPTSAITGRVRVYGLRD
jgi:hypothetical protein